MAELLLELFSEEVPSLLQKRGAEELSEHLQRKLTDHHITFKRADAYYTPRRIALIFDGLPRTQEDSQEERRGPRTNAPQAAIEGFLKSTGLHSVKELEERETPKGTFYFSVSSNEGKPTSELLITLIESLLSEMTWPKSMRWGESDIRWIRPLKSILCLFDEKTVPLTFGHLTSSNTTFGHRFLAPRSFSVKNARDYWEKLRQHYVMIDQEERRETTLRQCKTCCQEKKIALKEDGALLDEIVGLVEWPETLIGAIDNQFMNLPEEVLTTVMRVHQRYFCTLTKNDKLAPYFLTVANIRSTDSARIVQGNERVLRARLADAAFFFDTDQQQNLESRIKSLDTIIFHQQLGSLADKAKRIIALSKYLSVWIPHANLLLVDRGALLCKADLATKMVQEFPELQGVIGSYYAKRAGEDESVVRAIREHYEPLSPHHRVPTDPVSIAVALADKIDTLVGLFAIGSKPTGSQDPYGLRRAAIGVIRIILENKLRIPLKLVIERSVKSYPRHFFKKRKGFKRLLKKVRKEESEDELLVQSAQEVVEELLLFFEERIKVLLKGQSIRHDFISAIFHGGEEDDLLRLVSRVYMLEAFLKTEEGENVLAGYRRAAHILEKEERRDQTEYRTPPVKNLLQTHYEEALFSQLEECETEIDQLLKEDGFADASKALAKLRDPIDQFFEHVMVNCEDPNVRENRLKLLSRARHLTDKIADLSSIEG